MHRILFQAYQPTRLLAALLLGFGLSACGGEDAQSLLEQAKSAQAKGDMQAATIHLKSAIQADEKNSEARLLLGKLYLARGDYVAAEKELAKARGYGQKPETVNPLIARALFGMHEYQRLIDELPLAEASESSRPFLQAMHVQSYLALQQNDEARRLLDEALKASPDEAELHFVQAKLHLADRQIDQAMTSLERALQLEPKRPDFLVLKADILKAKGELAEASKIYQAVLSVDANNAAARISLASFAINENRFEDARKEIDAVLKHEPNHVVARYNRALIAFRQNQASKAREDLAPVLKSAPDYLPAVLLAGAVEYSLGSMEAAESHLKKVLAAAPQNLYARRLLAASQVKRGQINEAETSLKKLNPETSEDASTLVLAGEVALAKKNFVLAEQFFAKAAKLKPESAEIRTELGLARLALGDPKAVTDLQQSASLDEESSRADTLLVLNHLKRKEFDLALSAIDKMEKKMPGSPQPANYRGAALMGKNDLPGARKQFENALAIDPKFFPAAANLAQLDVQEGKPQLAKSRFESVLKADPKNFSAMLAIAEIEGRAKNEKAYVDWLTKAAKTRPDAIQAHRLLAQYYLSKKEPNKALALAREAYDARPNNQDTLQLLGTTQLAAGEKQNARDSFTKLVERTPNSPAAHLALAQSQITLNEWEAAKKSLNKVLELDQTHAQARLGLAQVQLKTGHVDDALKEAQTLKRSLPKEPLGSALEGDILMSQKNYQGALAAYDQAAKIKPSNAVLLKQVGALKAAGQAAEADRRLAAWVKSHPDDHAVRLAYAEHKITAANYAEAADHYLYLNQKLPNQLGILNNLAYAFAQQKDKRAITYAEQAYKLQPDNPAVLDTYGWALVQNGQLTKGTPLLQKALSRQPDAGDIQYHYASALALAGDKARARQELQRLLQSGVDFSLKPAAQSLLNDLSAK